MAFLELFARYGFKDITEITEAEQAPMETSSIDQADQAPIFMLKIKIVTRY